MNDALRISPQFTSRDWYNLDQDNPDHWQEAAEIVRDRLDGRFFRFASICLRYRYSGFVVLAIDSLLAETIQQFKEGIVDGSNPSGPVFKRFFESEPFQPDFDETARQRFWKDIRCGLLHQAEARGRWLIRRNQPSLLQRVADGPGYIIDVKRFHEGVRRSLDDYLKLIADPTSQSLRTNLWVKMNQICCVRTARGALYEP